jgi:hypothetical protein
LGGKKLSKDVNVSLELSEAIIEDFSAYNFKVELRLQGTF